MVKSRLIRVSIDFDAALNKIWESNNRSIPKTEITKIVAKNMNCQNTLKPVIEINYWPIKRKVKLYRK